MASSAPPHEPNPSTPFSLMELADQAQRQWAPIYAREHRIQRCLAWISAIALSTYVFISLLNLDIHSSLYDRAISIGIAAYAPLWFIQATSFVSLRGKRITFGWILAWLFLIADAAMGIEIFSNGHYIKGALYELSTLGIGGVLCYGLHIPLDPSIDWDLVSRERTSSARTARGGQSYETIITDYRQAEKVAASWLRRFGYQDAEVTPDRQDNGIDVESLGAVAQVKNWKTKRVGIAEVQRLEGSARRGQACFFFAAHGYTKAAHRWAENTDHPIRLFILGQDGNITACNHRAKRTLWAVPFQIPVTIRRPISPWIILSLSLFMFTDGLCAAILAIFLFRHSMAWGIWFGLMGAGGIHLSSYFGGRPAIKVAQNIRNRRPLDIRTSFTLERNNRDKGLPSDDFAGYEYNPESRFSGIVLDISIQLRTLARIIRSRLS